MMLKYEMKKILNKRLNCVLFIADLLIVVVFGAFQLVVLNLLIQTGRRIAVFLLQGLLRQIKIVGRGI